MIKILEYAFWSTLVVITAVMICSAVYPVPYLYEFLQIYMLLAFLVGYFINTVMMTKAIIQMVSVYL